MRTLFDEDGNEIQVPDEQELESYKSAQDKLKEVETELSAFREGKGVKNLREVLQRRDEALAERDQKLREYETKLAESEAEEKTDKKKKFDPDELPDLMRKTSEQAILDVELRRSLASYNEQDRKLVERYYKKMTSDETVSIDNYQAFLRDAERMAFPGQDSRANASYGGRSPRVSTEPQDFSETDEGKDLASKIGLSFVNRKAQ